MLQNLAVSKPILYGNTAEPLGNSKTPDMPPDHTHRWTIFLKDPSPKKPTLHKLIKKVIFKLHDTYPNPARTIESPGPFEVTETGWGEFEIAIKIFFVSEAAEKNVTLYHHLKLHPYIPSTENIPLGTQPVHSYIYDELVFGEPTEAMFEILTQSPGAILPAVKSEREFGHIYSAQTENEELDRLGGALDKVYNQVKKIKDHIKALEKERVSLVGEAPSTAVLSGSTQNIETV